jgi:tetratricopeptide (TPR) repeat protein
LNTPLGDENVGRNLQFTFCLFAAIVSSSGCQSQLGGQAFRKASPAQSSWWNPLSKLTSGAKSPRVPDWRTPELMPKDAISLEKPSNPGANLYVKAAQLCEARNQFSQAITHYHKALEIDSQDLPALLGLARLYGRLGQPSKALSLYELAVADHPDSSAVFNDLGLCYAKQERWNDALANFQRAIRMQPENTRYRNNIARVLVVTGRPDQALQELATVFPPAVARYNVGFLAKSAGDVATAQKFLRLAIEADSRMLNAREMLASLQPQKDPPSAHPSSPQFGLPHIVDSGLRLEGQNRFDAHHPHPPVFPPNADASHASIYSPTSQPPVYRVVR